MVWNLLKYFRLINNNSSIINELPAFAKSVWSYAINSDLKKGVEVDCPVVGLIRKRKTKKQKRRSNLTIDYYECRKPARIWLLSLKVITRFTAVSDQSNTPGFNADYRNSNSNGEIDKRKDDASENWRKPSCDLAEREAVNFRESWRFSVCV